jgi:hypothetical protein
MRRIWQVRRYCWLTCKIFLFQTELSAATYHMSLICYWHRTCSGCKSTASFALRRKTSTKTF